MKNTSVLIVGGAPESYLESSYFIGRNRRVLGDGVLDRLCRLTHISLMLAPDSDFVFGNDVQVIKAVKTFPGHHRRWIEISQRFTACSFFGLVALGAGEGHWTTGLTRNRLDADLDFCIQILKAAKTQSP
ncbi:hypothetical protein [Pseudomonas sp. LB3P25]